MPLSLTGQSGTAYQPCARGRSEEWWFKPASGILNVWGRMISRAEYLRRVDEAMLTLDTASICNGVGSKLALLRIFRCPDDVAELFREAADWHDVAYYLGGGSVEKMYADTAFFNYLMEAVYEVECSFLARWRLRLWAYLCYTAVRLGGELAFNWTKE